MTATDSMNHAKYELFKLFWMMMNGYTVTELINSVLTYRSELLADAADDTADIKHLQEQAQEIDTTLPSEWESERGFGDNIWPCFAEFMNSDIRNINNNTTLFQDFELFLDIVSKKLRNQPDS